MKTSVALLASAVLLTGCTIDRRTVLPEVAETAPATTLPAPSRPVAPVIDNEDMFLEGVHTIHDGPVYISDRELLNTGWAVCEAASSGVTIWEMVDVITRNASDDNTYNLLMEVTVGALMMLCPEYEYLLTELNAV